MKKALTGAFVVALIAALVLPMSSGCAKSEVPTIKVGVIGPMQYMAGKHHWYAATMARDEINEAGGVKVGEVMMPIELVKADSNEIISVPDATTAMEKLVTSEGVDLVVGGCRSEACLAMQDVAMEHQKVLIFCGPADNAICKRLAEDYDRYKYTFRMASPNSSGIGVMMISLVRMVSETITETLGVEKVKVAILAEKLVWNDAVIAAAKKMFPGLGMEVVGVWRPSPSATDMGTELSAIKAAGAHLIFTAFSTGAGVVYAKQWEELGIPACSAGINVEAETTDFWEATGGKGNYETTLNMWALAEITSKTKPFLDNYAEEFGTFPVVYSMTYDGLYVLKEAIERAGSLDNDAVVAELLETEYEGTGGIIAFYPPEHVTPHDLVFGPGYTTAVAVQWLDGEMKCVWPYGWQDIMYPGTVPYTIPPRVIEHFGRAPAE